MAGGEKWVVILWNYLHAYRSCTPSIMELFERFLPIFQAWELGHFHYNYSKTINLICVINTCCFDDLYFAVLILYLICFLAGNLVIFNTIITQLSA